MGNQAEATVLFYQGAVVQHVFKTFLTLVCVDEEVIFSFGFVNIQKNVALRQRFFCTQVEKKSAVLSNV
jgi:hypothetical protein